MVSGGSLSGSDFDEEGVSEAIALTGSKTAKDKAVKRAGKSFTFGVKFPKIDDADGARRSLVVSDADGSTRYFTWGAIKCSAEDKADPKVKCKELTPSQEDGVYFFAGIKLGIGNEYKIAARTRVGGKLLSAIIPLQAGKDDEITKAEEDAKKVAEALRAKEKSEVDKVGGKSSGPVAKDKPGTPKGKKTLETIGFG